MICQSQEHSIMGILQAAFFFLRAFLLGRAAVAIENLALRQQLAVFKHSGKRPRLRPRDRVFWVLADSIIATHAPRETPIQNRPAMSV